MQFVISKFLRGINNEYKIPKINSQSSTYSYSVSPYPEDEIYNTNVVQFSICEFIVSKSVFPVYLHIKSNEKELLSAIFEYERIITFNRKSKEYYYRIEVNSKETLQKMIDLVFIEAIAGNLLLITPEKSILFVENNDEYELSQVKLIFKNETYYIWVGYDGVSWEIITNESKYSYENFKKGNVSFGDIDYLIDEEDYDYDISE